MPMVRLKTVPLGERYVFSGLVAQFGLARLPVTQEVAGSSPVGPVLLAKGKISETEFAPTAQAALARERDG